MPTQIDGSTGVSKVQDGVIVQADLAPNVVGNGPAFSSYVSAGSTSITSGTPTKVNTDSPEFSFGNLGTPSKFQPNVEGYYQIQGRVNLAAGSMTVAIAYLYKNGAAYKRGNDNRATVPSFGALVSSLMYLNGTTDYVELYGSASGTSPTYTGGDAVTSHFSGFLARAA